VGDGLVLATIDTDGKVTTSPVVPIDTGGGLPTELCWLSVTPDDRWVYATNFGYGYLTSYRIEGNVLSIAKDPACPKVPGDGTFQALNNTVSSGPSDNWLSPDGAFLYQIYGNASKLVGYACPPTARSRRSRVRTSPTTALRASPASEPFGRRHA
jgi:hypothetical protein